VLAALAVLGAVSLILQSHPIHSALSLILVMVSLAGLYLLMGAEFIAAVQIIVYGGAVMVLFIFRDHAAERGSGRTDEFSKLAAFGRSSTGARVGLYHRRGYRQVKRPLGASRGKRSDEFHPGAFDAAVFRICLPV